MVCPKPDQADYAQKLTDKLQENRSAHGSSLLQRKSDPIKDSHSFHGR